MRYLHIFFLFLAACGKPQNGLKVAATPIPQAQILEFVKPTLQAQGIDLHILVVEDYNIPNRALADGEVDANFFQHIPFMEAQIHQFGYPIESYGKIELEPMGLYSKKIKSLSDLKNGAQIAVPNDPTNEGRALLLLQAEGLIELDDPHSLQATVLNISENPKNLKFIEADAAMLPRTLEDVDVAAINTNFALEARLSPKNALALEGKDSPYANILTIRIGDEDRPDLKALKEAMTSPLTKAFILEKYKGAVLPAF